MHINTISPQRILDYANQLERKIKTFQNEFPETKEIIDRHLKFEISQIKFQAESMISDAFEEAILNNDLECLNYILKFNPEYQLKAATAISKIETSQISIQETTKSNLPEQIIVGAPRTADPNLLYFASSDKIRVESFLKHPAFNWLSAKGKEYVLENLDESLEKGFRVMDPLMHPHPQTMTRNMKHHQTLKSLL